MWFLGIRKKGKRSIDEDNIPDLEQLINRHEILELHENVAELRFWLPELCKQALDETVEYNQTTRARYLRELFVAYLYGEHELLRMRSKKSGLYYEPPPPPPSTDHSLGVRYSRVASKEVVPGLGKNIIPIKLFLPEKVKNDLQALADKATISLSTFVREILISHLLGHTLWQERLRSWTPEEEEIGNNWERGITEPVYVYADEENFEREPPIEAS